MSGLLLEFPHVACSILLTQVPQRHQKLNYEQFTVSCVKMTCLWLEDLPLQTWENSLLLLKLPIWKLTSCLYLRIWLRTVCKCTLDLFNSAVWEHNLSCHRVTLYVSFLYLIFLERKMDSYHFFPIKYMGQFSAGPFLSWPEESWGIGLITNSRKEWPCFCNCSLLSISVPDDVCLVIHVCILHSIIFFEWT